MHGELQGRRLVPSRQLEKANWTDTKNLVLDCCVEGSALDTMIDSGVGAQSALQRGCFAQGKQRAQG